MKALERYLFGEVDAVRPWLLQRLVLLMVAFDCWLDLVPHGGRYGFNDFNVSHFAFLDALQPVPGPGTYVGVILLTGLVAFVQALTRPTRAGLAVVCGLYTYGWLMSMLDSYQHHYMLSLVLLCFVFFPRLVRADVYAGAEPSRAERAGGALLLGSLVEIVFGLAGAPTPLGLLGPGSALETPGWIWAARVGLGLLGGLLVFLKEPGEADGAEATRSKKGAKKDEKPSTKVRRKRGREKTAKKKTKKTEATAAPAPAGPTTSAWGYVLLCVSTAIVYFYTAVTKLSDDWRQGHALERLARTDATLALRDRAVGEGLPVLGVFREAGFWELMATGAILVQFVTLAGYLVAARQDALSPRWRRLVQLALFAPLSFHLAAEVGLTLDIGWFSFYMIVIPAVVFLPAPLLRVLAAGWSWPAQRVAAAFAPRAKESEGAEAEAQARFEAGVLLVAAGATAVGIGALLDLPGALGAGIGASVLLVLGAAWAFRAGVPLRARGWAATTALGAVVMWASIAQSDVRFDYYRFVGGEYRRHGEYALALDAYERANAHVVSPWCVYEGRELLECYRRRETAEAIAEEQGLTVNERNRQRQEDEMRSYVERGIDRAEP